MSSPGYNITFIDGNEYYTKESMVGFGLNLGGASLSIAGCIVSHYLVKQFKSLLSLSLLLMNLGSCLNLFFTGLAVLALGDSQGVFVFFSWIFGMMAMEMFMIQIMYRMWLLPSHDRWANIIQWILFVGASGNYSVNVLCNIPTSLDDTTINCYSNVMLASTGVLILALDIFNSCYVIYQVTTNRYHLSQNHEHHEYLGFMIRRLPILVLNMIIAVAIITLALAGSQNSYDAVDYGIALIVFISQYYWMDLAEFSLSNRPNSDRMIDKRIEMSPRQSTQDRVVLDMEGNIVSDLQMNH
jgi:hypothetical protein